MNRFKLEADVDPGVAMTSAKDLHVPSPSPRSRPGIRMVGRRSARRHLGRRTVGIESAIGRTPVTVHAHELGNARALESFLKQGGVRSLPLGGLRFVGSSGRRHVSPSDRPCGIRTGAPASAGLIAIVAWTALPGSLQPSPPPNPPDAAASTDPDLAEYVRSNPNVPEFLRTAKAMQLTADDFAALIADLKQRRSGETARTSPG